MDAESTNVYVCRDETGAICFVGRTRHVERRNAEHAVRGWTIAHTLETDVVASRDVEQWLVNRLGRQRSDDPKSPFE